MLAKTINAAFTDCLYREDEIPSDGSMPVGMIKVESVRGVFGLNPERVKNHRDEVIDAIAMLHPSFRLSGEGSGGGMSFLQLPLLADGTHWAEHPTCNELVAISIALGIGGIHGPRETWSLMPGGMPYVWFDASADSPAASGG